MESKKNDEKFELMKLDPNNLVELDQWELKLKTIVEENPFIQITDKETFKEAKKRRTNLKSGRTEVEKQDGLIATFLQKFRKSTKEKNEKLVLIVKPHETKQQAEIDRFQKILDDEKDEKDRIENERVDGIKAEIKRVEDLLDVVINASTLGAIEQDKGTFLESKKTDFDFQEFQFMFDEMIEKKTFEFSEKIEQLKNDEDLKLQNLTKDREAKLNQMIIDGQEVVDGIDGELTLKQYNQMITGIFQTIIGCDVEFDEATTNKMDQEKQKALLKVEEKLNQINQQKINDQKQRIFDVREGLLDLVFQMTTENHESSNKSIFEAFEQEVIPELQDEFDRMKSMVNQSLVAKMQTINSELKDKEKKMNDLFESRIKKLLDLGCEKNDDGSINWFNFKYEKEHITSPSDEKFQELINEIEKQKKDSKAEQERQELIRQDKITMADMFVNFKNQINEKKPKGLFDNDESIEFFNIIKHHFIEYCDERISNINKF